MTLAAIRNEQMFQIINPGFEDHLKRSWMGDNTLCESFSINWRRRVFGYSESPAQQRHIEEKRTRDSKRKERFNHNIRKENTRGS